VSPPPAAKIPPAIVGQGLVELVQGDDPVPSSSTYRSMACAGGAARTATAAMTVRTRANRRMV
jgi:hypothetical protein